jgi:hypothetical protein
MKIFRRTPSAKQDNESQLFCYSCKVPWGKEFSWGQTAQKLTLTSDHMVIGPTQYAVHLFADDTILYTSATSEKE